MCCVVVDEPRQAGDGQWVQLIRRSLGACRTCLAFPAGPLRAAYARSVQPSKQLHCSAMNACVCALW